MAEHTHQSRHRRHTSRPPTQHPVPAKVQDDFVPPPHNEKILDREELFGALSHLASLIIGVFEGHKVTIYAHGGAVMVLHPRLGARPTTRDVDVCLREFDKEWEAKGIKDAEKRLRYCIYETARQRRLGVDWMNNCPDVALPWATDSNGQKYDPIVRHSQHPENHKDNTIYTSSHLDVVGVSWQWAVALKLVRYRKNDPKDIACILHYAINTNASTWSRSVLEAWVRKTCWAMRYDAYSPEQLTQLRDYMRDAIRLAYERAGLQHPYRTLSPSNMMVPAPTFQPPAPPPPHMVQQPFVHHFPMLSHRPPVLHSRHSSRSNQLSVF